MAKRSLADVPQQQLG